MTDAESYSDLTKVSFNAIRRTMQAMDTAALHTGLSRTDCLNRAVQLYALIEGIQVDGGRLVVQHADGTSQRLDIS